MFECLAKLLKSKHRPLWQDYCRYLRLGWQHYADKKIEPKLKIAKISLLEKAIRKDFPLPDTLLARLQKAFVVENLSLYLLLEPLQIWRWLAADKKNVTEAQISEIIAGLASPAARMLMVLNNEGPSTYLPMTSLLSAQYLLNALENKDALLQKSGKRKRFWLSKINGLLKNAAVILRVIKSKRLKFLLATELNRLVLQVDKMQNNKQSGIEGLDRIKIFLYSLYQFIVIRRRTTQTRGI